MRASLTRGGVLLAVLLALPTAGAFAAAAYVCHPDPPGTKTARVAGAVTRYKLHGHGVSIVYRGRNGCSRTYWAIGRSLSRTRRAPDAACAASARASSAPAGGTGRVSLIRGSADLPDRIRVVSAGGTARSWPLADHVQRFDAFGHTAVFAGPEREVYAADLRNGRVALVGLDRHGDTPQIDAPGVVFQDNLYKEQEYSGRTLMKFIPAAAVDRSLSRAGAPVDLPGPIEAIGMDGFRVALAVHEPGECAQIMYWNIAWDYLSKITDEDERTCELTARGGVIRSVAIGGIRSAWVIRSRNAERLLTSNSTACFDRIVASVPRRNGRLAAPSGDGALAYAMTNVDRQTTALGTVGDREVEPLVRIEGAPIAISLDGGRFAVLNRDRTIDLRSATGELTGTIGQTDAAAIALRANHVVVLTRSGRVQVFGTATQAKLHDWAAPAGSAGRVDAHFGIAVVTAGGKVYAISLRTGRRSLIASVPGRVFAQIEPSGIAYAYNTGTRGHVRFVRLAEVEAAVG